MVEIRRATSEDQQLIRTWIFQERLDPTSLSWRQFLVAEVKDQVVGIGQIKVYPGCEELGSLIVKKRFRGQGIGALLIAELEKRAGRPLYLLCPQHNEGYYLRFGYCPTSWFKAPLILKLKLLPTYAFRIFGIRVLIMVKSS